MNLRRWLGPTLFTLILAATVTGYLLTDRQPPPAPVDAGAKPEPKPEPKPGKPGKSGKAAKAPAKPSAPVKERLVDESPLQTARKLVPLAVSDEEKQLARQAERLANHEVDLAFADALRQARENPPEPTPATLELIARRDAEEASVAAIQKHIADLGRQLAAAPERAKDSLADQLDVAKAELELEQDELEQASEDLARAGGDTQARIQRLKAAHAAVEPAAAAAPAQAPVFYQPGSFVAKLVALRQEATKMAQVRKAWQEAQDKHQRMVQRKANFAARVAKEAEERQNAKSQAAGFSRAGHQQTEASRLEAQSTLKSLQHFTSQQRRLADFGRRIQDQQGLVEVYGTWGDLVAAQERAALHVVLRWFLVILGVLLVVTAASRYLEAMFIRLMKGPERVGRLFKVAKFALQAVGAITILFLTFGLPSQMSTVFGLAGAGLTVALKDFIVAFFGWFILVGRNGLHVGDWVEIKGVGGEVVEIGLLRTLLLETGNWTDSSHPTGRIVSFVNSFAMEGHFFNFSTTGQWMWDELRVTAPKDQDPYPFIDAIRALVHQETEANAKLAEQEWRQGSNRGRRATFSAEPAINVVPTAAGVEIQVRYITRAYERHATQKVLNEALMELLHGKRSPVA